MPQESGDARIVQRGSHTPIYSDTGECFPLKQIKLDMLRIGPVSGMFSPLESQERLFHGNLDVIVQIVVFTRKFLVISHTHSAL